MLLKRFFDMILSLILLILLLPVIAMVAIVVAIGMGTPVLFRQDRPGLKGRIFRMCKFRTMKDLRDAEGNPLPDEQRMTPVGNLLRRTRLDELPELLHILKGEMSFVGPRPLLPATLERFTEFERRRLDVRPGLTGWAQVNGNTRLIWSEKMALDVWYVDHRSLKFDLLILFKTLWVVIGGENVARTAVLEAVSYAHSAGRSGS